MKYQNMLRHVLLAAAFLSTARGQKSNLSDCGVRQDVDCTDICTSTTIIFYSGSTETSYELSAAGARDLLDNSEFSTSRQTIIFQHGYTRSPTDEGSLAIKNAFIAMTTAVNYLAVNAADCFAGSLVNTAQYQAAAKKSPCIGRLTADFLQILWAEGLASDNIYVIGHSLGGPTMSSAAKFYTEDTNEKIHRLTVLDSAGPCFGTTANQPQPGDAKFVDAIHSNMARFGSSATLGDADFYPNRGYEQPGCQNFDDEIQAAWCSHARVEFLYAESVNSGQCFVANAQQDSTAIMGYHWGHETGSYYLETNSESEFCLGS